VNRVLARTEFLPSSRPTFAAWLGSSTVERGGRIPRPLRTRLPSTKPKRKRMNLSAKGAILERGLSNLRLRIRLSMRHYTTKPLNGGFTFQCSFCEHRVTTLDLSSLKGNRRTQAATLINKHVVISHPAKIKPVFINR
jgi:hypothetical protein